MTSTAATFHVGSPAFIPGINDSAFPALSMPVAPKVSF